MRSNPTPLTEDFKLDREIEMELTNVLTDEEVEATLQERLEAFELTWRIIDNGLLDEH